jgi:DNA-binding NtrC family response regulator
MRTALAAVWSCACCFPRAGPTLGMKRNPMSWIDSSSWNPVAAPDPSCDAGHVCLVGSQVSADWALIAALKRRHQVTVAESIQMLRANPLLRSVDVLALECTPASPAARIVRQLRAWQPDLCIVLVGEAIPQNEVAEAFREGALDFFSDPTDAELLAERVHSLCRRYRRERLNGDFAGGSDAVS